MTRELKASYRDADNRKYKVYADEKQWTIESGSAREFSGTKEGVLAFLKELGIEAVEGIKGLKTDLVVEDDITEVAESIPLKLVDEEGEEMTTDEVSEKIEEATEEKIIEKVEEAVIEEVAETNQTMTPEEKEILALKAKLEELEK